MAEKPSDPYAEGNRQPSDCWRCGSPVWIVYHGQRNHTLEPRNDKAKYRAALESILDVGEGEYQPLDASIMARLAQEALDG